MSNKKTSKEENITQKRFRQGRLILNLFIGIVTVVLILLEKIPGDTIIPIFKLILNEECPHYLVKDEEEYNENVEKENENSVDHKRF